MRESFKPIANSRSEAWPLARVCSRVKDRERFPPATVRVASRNLGLIGVTALFSGAELRYESGALATLGSFQYRLGRGNRDSVLRLEGIHGDRVAPSLQLEAKSFEREVGVVRNSRYGFTSQKRLIEREHRLKIAGREVESSTHARTATGNTDARATSIFSRAPGTSE